MIHLAGLNRPFILSRNGDTPPIIVERIVMNIDDVVHVVRIDGRQGTSAGEREVKQARRKTMLKYKPLRDQELRGRAFSYVREYY